MQNKIEFYPKYSKKFKISVIFSLLIFSFAPIFPFLDSNVTKEWWFYVCLVLLILFPIAFIRGFPKKIVFSDYMYVTWYIIGEKLIGYDEIKDIGDTLIVTNKGKIVLREMENSYELKSTLVKIINEKTSIGEIGSNQIQGKLVKKEAATYKSIIPSIIVATVLIFGLNHFNILPNWDTELIFLLIWTPILYLFYFYFKRKSKTPK